MIHLLKHSIPSVKDSLQLLAATVLIGGSLQMPAMAEMQLACNAPSGTGGNLVNQVSATYIDGDAVVSNGLSESLTGQVTTGGVLSIVPQGIQDSSGNLIYNLDTIATALNDELLSLGWSQDEAKQGSLAAVQAFAGLPADVSEQQTIATVKTALAQAVPAHAEAINSGGADQNLTLALSGLAASSLKSIGLTDAEVQTASQAAIAVITTTASSTQFTQITQTAFQDAITAVPVRATLLTTAKTALDKDLDSVRAGKDISLHSGDILRFGFSLTNTGSAAIEVQPPTVANLQQSITGSATVTAVSVDALNPTPATLSIAPGQQMSLTVETKVGTIPSGAATLGIAFGNGCNGGITQQTLMLLPSIRTTSLTDPFGHITGCDGGLLPDYRGIQVALYRPAPNDSTGEVRDLLPLTTTELPDRPGNNIPVGLEPNRQNSNPFFLTNGDQGRYNFLLGREQLRPGQIYILVISPPPNSDYSERRIRIAIGQRTSEGFSYRATSLDGRPIQATDNRTSINGTLRVDEATQVGLTLVLLDVDTSICQAQSIQIVKTGDRASAEPGDTVIYRLLVRNLATTAIDHVVLTDTLPLGFSFVDDSVRAEMQNGRRATVTTSHSGSTISFQINEPIPQGSVLNLAYAAQLTPDAVRGSGDNSAIARGRRNDNQWVVRDGPSIYHLRIEPGIVTDCGTILGRVFEDRNFDGEQQAGEPGIPNAVIFLDDGNRITTDANGLFSVANVLPGYRTGALDLTSLPGYTLAPNYRFIERNSPSRLVQLEPGGMVRMNFAVTPTFHEEAGQ